MPARRVLFLDATHLTAYLVGGGTVHAEGEFSADPPGLEAFGEYLARWRGSVFMLLANVAEEGFQLEDIPHAAGKDRAALVARKLTQYFYGTPLTLAASQGRLKEGRRDERLLLMGLTRPQHFEPWLAVLRETESVLAGIYTLAQTFPALLAKDSPARLLLITLTHGGLRQTFFADGQLRFSRLTALATGSQEESAIATTIEATKMHQYLVGQRLIERGKPLTTRVLVHPINISAMRARCHDSAELRFEFLDLIQEAGRLGLRTPLADSRAEMLFCHLLAKRPPAVQFAPAAERQFHRLWQTRFVLKSLSGLILVGGLLFAAKLGVGMLQLQGEIDSIEQQTQRDQQRYDSVLQALPQIPLSTDSLRALVGRYESVQTRAQGPEPLLAQLSQSLDAYPNIALERIEWSIVEQLAPAAPGEVLPPHMAGGPYAQARIDARLPIAMVGDQRGQLALVADFAKHLGTPPATLVTVIQQPVDTQSGQTLKSSDEHHTPEAPRFSLRLTRKL
jgi:hypothetical protein